MKSRLSILAACAGAALALSACSPNAAPSTQTGNATPTTTTPKAAADPVKWTGAFCEGTTPALLGALELVKLVGQNQGNNVALKEGMLKIVENGAKSAGEAEKKLKEVGSPGPEAQAVHDELLKLFGDASKDYAGVLEGLKKIDPNAPDFMDQVDKLGGDSTDPSKLQDAIKKLDADPKYKEAMVKAPECVEMRNKLAALFSGGQ